MSARPIHKANVSTADVAAALRPAAYSHANLQALAAAHACLVDTGGMFLLDPLLHPLTRPALELADSIVANPDAALIEIVAITSPRLRRLWGCVPKEGARHCVVMAATEERMQHFRQVLRGDDRAALPCDLSAAEQKLWGAFTADGFFECNAPDTKRLHGLWLLEACGLEEVALAQAKRLLSTADAKRIRTAAVSILVPHHMADVGRSEPSAMAEAKKATRAKDRFVGDAAAAVLTRYLAKMAVQHIVKRL